jgi:hypothetical protein|tara:strand:+ start:4334 stop:4789 length:456 start_codon:yes stop_codon:yes gene_type:complete
VIKRITNPEEFNVLIGEIDLLFKYENENEGHFLKHNKEYIINAFSHKHILAWDFFVWANVNEENKYDAIIAFVNNKNEKFGEEIFTEYLWLSKNGRIGHKLLVKALDFARQKEFKYVSMSCVHKHPKSEKVSNFYKRLGFVKDCETYIAEL